MPVRTSASATVPPFDGALRAIDQALAECDASALPAFGTTCLRSGCPTPVFRWLNPHFCSEDCRAAEVSVLVERPLDIEVPPRRRVADPDTSRVWLARLIKCPR